MENQPQPIEQTQVTYAGFGKRYAAMIIDSVIITFFSSPIYWQFQRMFEFWLRKLGRKRSFDFDITDRFDKIESMSLNYYILFMIIVVWCYSAGMESSPWKATIGKKLLGLEVTDENGDRISFIKASGRHFGKILSKAVFYIGYFVMLGNNKKQTWHDSMSGCVVKEK